MSSRLFGRFAGFYHENPALVWLSAVIFVNQLGFGGIIPVVPLYARAYGVSQAAVGLSLAVYGLARFLVNVPTGQMADRLGRRRTLVIGEVLTAVGNLLCGMSGSFEQFLLFRFISGAGASMVTTSGQIILADLTTKAKRGRTMAVYQGVFLVAVGFGPLPGGLIADWFGLNVPFYSFAALGLLAALVAYDKVPETRGLREQREGGMPAAGQQILPLRKQLRLLFESVGFRLVSLVTFVQFFARTGAIFAVVPILGASKLGLGPDQIGTGMALVSLTNLGTIYVSGVLLDRYGRKPVIVPATFATALSVAVFAFAPSYGWFSACLAYWGLVSGISGTAPASYAADIAPPGMNAMTMSSYRMISDMGYVIGPLLLGGLADVAGNEAALFFTAGLFLVSATLFGLFAPETAGRKPAVAR